MATKSKVFKCVYYSILGFLVIVYSIFGGYLFSTLESKQGENPRERVQSARDNGIKKLWHVIRGQGKDDRLEWEKNTRLILKDFEQEVFQAVSQDGWDGEDVGSDYTKWDMVAAVLYSVTLITTIGYGNITPKTDAGKIATIFYSIFGIPLFLIFLAKIGRLLAVGVRLLFSNSINKRLSRNELAGVPVTVSIIIIILYLLLGAVLFSYMEQWDYLTGAYFCFITISTIGLGDYVAGQGAGYHNRKHLIFTTIYVLIGLSIVVMSFNLMQEKVRAYVKKFARCLASGNFKKPFRRSGKSTQMRSVFFGKNAENSTSAV